MLRVRHRTRPFQAPLRAGLAALAALVLSAAATRADTLSIELHPSRDPDSVAACALSLDGMFFRLVQVQGAGLPARRPMSWPAAGDDRRLFRRSLEALAAGGYADPKPETWAVPVPPYTILNWSFDLPGGAYRGIGILGAGALPEPLQRVVSVILRGSLCDRPS